MGNCISPLRRAIRAKDATKVEALLEEAGEGSADFINEDYTADCFCLCLLQNTTNPLLKAISLQAWDIVWILLKYGADPECTGVWSQTPLHIACRQNNLDLVKHLVEGFHVNAYPMDDFGRCPLHTSCLSQHAIYNGDISVLQYFHGQGKLQESNLKLTDDAGNTILHTAARNGHANAVKYLLSLGADHRLTNDNGETPSDVAKVNCGDLLMSGLSK